MPRPRLITGPPAALEHALAAQVREAKQGNPLAPVTIITGGSLLRPYLRRRLADPDLLGGHINVHVLTPSEFALQLGELRLIADGRLPINPLADRALTHEIARHTGGYFAPVAATPGFANALHRLFGELRGAGVSAAQLAEHAGAKQREIAKLYSDYLSVRSPFYDQMDALAAAEFGRLQDRAVSLFGIWQITALLRRALERVAERVQLAVFLPVGGARTDDVHDTARAWLSGLDAEVTTLEGATSRTALGDLGQRLFKSTTAGKAPQDDSVRLLSAPDPGVEAREAARACLRWARQGIAFHEMAIAYRHGGIHRGLIDSALREAGIPIYLHEGTPLSERPLGRQVLALLDLTESDLPRAELMQFLADARLPKLTWDRYEGPSAPRWDSLSRRAGIVSGAQQWQERLELLRKDLRGDDDVEQEDWIRDRIRSIEQLQRFVADLNEAVERRPSLDTWSAHLTHLRTLLETYVADSEGVVGALAPLADLDALGTPVNADRFAQAARAAIEGMRLSDVSGERQGAFARRGVNVLDVNSLRQLSFRAVAVLGLVERGFPSPVRQDPLLLDDERLELNQRLDLDVPLRARGADPEPLQFAMAVGSAREQLVLSFARGDGTGGRPQLPSSFFSAAAAALTRRIVNTEDVDALPAPLFQRVSAEGTGAADPGVALSAAEYDRILLEGEPALGRALLESEHPSFARAVLARNARFHDASLTEYDGLLGPSCAEHLAARVGPQRTQSPTGLESYAECPYRYFLGNVLGLRELNEPEAVDRIDALNRGSLIHRILERFLSECPAHPNANQREEQRAQLLAIGEEECRLAEQRGLTGYPSLWRHDRRSILEDLIVWLDTEIADGDGRRFDQGAYEVRFGFARPGEVTSPISVDDPIEIELGGPTLRLTGRIDRLEWEREGDAFRVIDYKTGRSGYGPKEDALKGGRALQLPLYLLAGGALLKRPPEQGRAEYVYPTRRGDFKRQAFNGSALTSDVTDLVASLLADLRAGDFHAEPDDDACKFCNFNALCDSSRKLIRENKAQDPRVAAFMQRRSEHA